MAHRAKEPNHLTGSLAPREGKVGDFISIELLFSLAAFGSAEAQFRDIWGNPLWQHDYSAEK